MFHTINGVQIKEHTKTKELPNILDKRFEIEYLDNVYLNKLVCIDIINIPVKEPVRKYGFKRLKDRGRMWMFVIKHKDFVENRVKYGEVCSIIHEKIGEYLHNEYGLSPEGQFIIDSMERVYIIK
jgi:hypothetical protein